MRRVWTFGGGVATAAALGIIALALGSGSTPASPPQDLPAPLIVSPPVAAAPRFSARGAGSCAAQACHGSAVDLTPLGMSVRRNEHSTWITRDPHNAAFEALAYPRSVRIAKNLKINDAQTDIRCLACHATPSVAIAQPSEERDVLLRDGVGCESCHGPSSRWAAEHTTFTWNGNPAQFSPEVKEREFGFSNVRDLVRRAEVCAGCHVGAPARDGLPARDVNHDLIAAGHPRLTFEYSAYVANYPKHWNTSQDPADMDARLWKIGQVATMRAAVDLLYERARLASPTGAAKPAPWPELAEYSCFSCHFALKDIDPSAKAYRGLRDADDPGIVGVPVWGSWHLPMLTALLKAVPQGAPASVEAAVRKLRATMSKFQTAPATVASEAKSLRDALDTWLAVIKDNPVAAEIPAIQEVLNRRVDGNRRAVVTSWDSAAQVYLALAAFYASQRSNDPKAKAELEEMLKQLGFPQGFDSPARGLNLDKLP